MGEEFIDKPSRQRYRVLHSREMKVDDMSSFLHDPGFTQEWKNEGLNDDDLRELEVTLLINRDQAGMLPECGGIRYSIVEPEPREGRRVFMLVVYWLYLPQRSTIYLCSIDDDVNTVVSLTSEDRRVLRAFAEEIIRTEGDPV